MLLVASTSTQLASNSQTQIHYYLKAEQPADNQGDLKNSSILTVENNSDGQPTRDKSQKLQEIFIM